MSDATWVALLLFPQIVWHAMPASPAHPAPAPDADAAEMLNRQLNQNLESDEKKVPAGR